MRQLIVFMNLTLDGVMQAPGRPDEDTRNGFQYGAWAVPFGAMQSKEASESLKNFGTLLLGRRTYEDFYSFWPKQNNNPFTEMLNNMPKYVASTNLHEPLDWINSTILSNNIPDAVAELKSQEGADIVIMGSGNLCQTLMTHNLIDRYVLLIHPLVLGNGQTLFSKDSPMAKLKLIGAKATPQGVAVLTYATNNT